VARRRLRGAISGGFWCSRPGEHPALLGWGNHHSEVLEKRVLQPANRSRATKSYRDASLFEDIGGAANELR
jgi:hypothetical protein